jgi:hypothetical protein
MQAVTVAGKDSHTFRLVAEPRCVVVTARHAAHVLTQAGVTDRLGTTILTDSDQLSAHLMAAR